MTTFKLMKKKLDEVIHMSNLNEFVKDLPNGLETLVGENEET